MTWVTAPLASALLVVAKANLAYPGNFSVTPLAQQEVDMIHTHHYEASKVIHILFWWPSLLLCGLCCFEQPFASFLFCGLFPMLLKLAHSLSGFLCCFYFILSH